MTMPKDNSLQVLMENELRLLASAFRKEVGAQALTIRAINGISGTICGNNNMEAALYVLDKLPIKQARKVAGLLEISLGHYKAKEEKEGKIYIIKEDEPLFLYDRKSGWTCSQQDKLINAPRKERAKAYKALCAKHFKLPKNIDDLKIVNEAPEDYGKVLLEQHKAFIAKAAKNYGKWEKSSVNLELRTIIETYLDGEELANFKNKAQVVTTAGIGGRPKIK